MAGLAEQEPEVSEGQEAQAAWAVQAAREAWVPREAQAAWAVQAAREAWVPREAQAERAPWKVARAERAS